MKEAILVALDNFKDILKPYVTQNVEEHRGPYTLKTDNEIAAINNNPKDRLLIKEIFRVTNSMCILINTHGPEVNIDRQCATEYGKLEGICTSQLVKEGNIWGFINNSPSDLQLLVQAKYNAICLSKKRYDEEVANQIRLAEATAKEANAKQIKQDLLARDQQIADLIAKVTELQSKLPDTRPGSRVTSRPGSPPRTSANGQTMFQPPKRKSSITQEDFLKNHFGEIIGATHYFLCLLSKFPEFNHAAINAIAWCILNYQEKLPKDFMQPFNTIQIQSQEKKADIEQILLRLRNVYELDEKKHTSEALRIQQFEKSLLDNLEQSTKQDLSHLSPEYAVLSNFKKFYIGPNDHIKHLKDPIAPQIPGAIEQGGLCDLISNKMAEVLNVEDDKFKTDFRKKKLAIDDQKLKANVIALSKGVDAQTPSRVAH